jgi:starch-binding outer membrane protein, SusD/RagB family
MLTMRHNNLICLLIILVLACTTGCKKEDEWLDVKYNKGDVVPKTLKDFQALLNNDNKMSQYFPPLGLVASDNYYLLPENWQNLNVMERNIYVWAKDIFPTDISSDWQSTYEKVFYCNVVLDGLNDIQADNSNATAYNTAKGEALFFRSFAFYNLVQTFAKPFSASAATDPGIPLRLSSDISLPSTRGTVAQAYERILTDLKTAEGLLQPLSDDKFRPSRTAAQALLARVYLGMADYANALIYAEKALNDYSTLMNFADLDQTAYNPFPIFIGPQPEVIFNCFNGYAGAVSPGWIASVDSVLYASYHDDDLRKAIFYQPEQAPSRKVLFKAAYSGVAILFAGLATNELYFIKAESQARTGHPGDAVVTLNSILEKRWRSGQFTPLVANTPEAATDTILAHRRKELPFTGMLRWEDLRRLNQEDGRKVTLHRQLGANSYTLAPNDPRYVFPIPKQEQLLFGLADNPR